MKAKKLDQDFQLPEKTIENNILIYLRGRQIFSWKVKTVGTFDTKLGRFRKPSPLYLKGVSDILGLYNGKMIAIEVKSKKGRLSEDQKLFLHNVNVNGGVGFVARSVEDVEERLAKWMAV